MDLHTLPKCIRLYGNKEIFGNIPKTSQISKNFFLEMWRLYGTFQLWVLNFIPWSHLVVLTYCKFTL